MRRPDPPPAPAIRRAGLADVDLLAEIHRRCFEDAWDRRAMVEIVSMPGVSALLADAPAATKGAAASAGLAVLRVAADEAELLTIGVIPDRRRRGIGRALVEAASAAAQAAGARCLYLEVGEDNQAARRLYQSLAFVEAGYRRGYYAARPPGVAARTALVLRRRWAGSA